METSLHTQTSRKRSRQSMEAGGYDCDFVDEPPSDLICLICTLVIKEPQQVSCCGKLFCKTCLTMSHKHCHRCPNCRKTKSHKSFPDLRSDRQIKSLKVSCRNSGCDWVGLLRELEDHEIFCAFAMVSCLYCYQLIQYKDLLIHTKDECPNRDFTCPFCEQTGPYQAMTTTHTELCPQRPISCPNACGEEHIILKELEHHLETCPKEVIFCMYHDMGCLVTLPREEMPNHEDGDQKQHLKMAAKAISELRTRSNKEEPLLVSKLQNFSQLKQWHKTFHTHSSGYELKLVVSPDGKRTKADGRYISLGIYLSASRNDPTLVWPFQGKIMLEILNQLEDNNHHQVMATFCVPRVPLTQRVCSKVFYSSRFLPHSKLGYDVDTNCQYLVDDALFIRISKIKFEKPWLMCVSPPC